MTATLPSEQQKLLRYGYYLDDGIVTPEELLKLGAGHEYHTNAAQEYQEFFSEPLEELSYEWHGRELIPDGDWGPASAQELEKPRCGEPDILPATAEEANWPTSCRMNLTTSYQPNMTLPGMSTLDIDRGIRQALINVMEDFEIGVMVDQASYPRTNVTIVPARLGGSILADQYLATNSCNFTSKGRMDSDRNWEFWYFVTVRSHEDGHAWGCPHSGDSTALMYPSINRSAIERRGKMNASDKAIMRSLGYKERTTPLPGPNPGPGPTPSDILTGTVTVNGQRYRVIGSPG